LLIEALIILSKICDPSNVILLIIGQGYIIDKLIPFKAYYLGAISDEYLLPILYSCADVVVVPSLSENFPNTILESLSCGIPVTAFSIGGIPDQVIHKYNGYLANPYSPQDLANGINWILDNTNKIDFKENCRNSIYGKFDIQYVAKKYIDLYSENFE
jgi:glycosyltransferase involved in cell wall biosynthesis